LIADGLVTQMLPIEELLSGESDLSSIRDEIREVIFYADSALDQVLSEQDDNIFELGDNRICYPHQRLSRLVRDWWPTHAETASKIKGICHFHPIDTQHSESDYRAMGALAEVAASHGLPYYVSLVLKALEGCEYVEAARGSEDAFVEYMVDMTQQGLIGPEALLFGVKTQPVELGAHLET
jgi:hypothetical protein